MEIKMKINLAKIKKTLFEDKIQKKIIYSFGLEPRIYSKPEDFTNALIQSLAQISVQTPLNQQFNNNEVFKAAVRSIGSNSRSWAVFKNNEKKIKDILCDYNPVLANKKIDNNQFIQDKISALLPGITTKNDTKAIIRWTRLLSENDNFYSYIKKTGNNIQERSLENRLQQGLQRGELLLCLVLCLNTLGFNNCSTNVFPATTVALKNNLPGMGFALTSEFMRNMKWDGFKPDRHIMRLFDLWIPKKDEQIFKRAEELKKMLGIRGKNFDKFLYYALLGISLSPNDEALSIIDNHVWLLGAYVEKKGKESKETYVT